MQHPTAIDQVKHQIQQITSQAFRRLRGQLPESEWKEFESFFWKIRPLVCVDYSKYNASPQSETSGPYPPERPSEDAALLPDEMPNTSETKENNE